MRGVGWASFRGRWGDFAAVLPLWSPHTMTLTDHARARRAAGVRAAGRAEGGWDRIHSAKSTVKSFV